MLCINALKRLALSKWQPDLAALINDCCLYCLLLFCKFYHFCFKVPTFKWIILLLLLCLVLGTGRFGYVKPEGNIVYIHNQLTALQPVTKTHNHRAGVKWQQIKRKFTPDIFKPNQTNVLQHLFNLSLHLQRVAVWWKKNILPGLVPKKWHHTILNEYNSTDPSYHKDYRETGSTVP